MKFLPFLVLLILIPISVYATHENQSTSCTITIQSEIIPVSYITENRGNHDNSFYPGDAFHYLFTFTGDEECTSFSVLPVISEGIFDVTSHNSILWDNGIEQTHTHTDSEMYPKYMTTFSYHKILESPFLDCVAEIGVPNSHRCPPKSEDVISENITFSYREDKVLTDSDQKKIKSLKTWCSNYRPPCLGYVLVETQNWGFTNMDGAHEHSNYSHTNESDESIILFENYVSSKCNNLEKYSGCVYGHVELEPHLRDEKCMWEELDKMNVIYDIENDFCVDIHHNLSLSIQGTKINCYYNNGIEICETIKVKQTKNITPNILSPEFEIILSDPPVKDRDNYDGKNKDGTYYPHDPIGIIHNPSMLWKDYRAETIQFETTKVYKLSNEYEYGCNSNSCEHKIKLDSVYPVSYNFGNGQGITIYNSTRNDFGVHDFDYTTIMTNLNREMYTAYNTIDRKIVDYFPQYESYPYPLLKDEKEYAFNDRQAVALFYIGSVEDDIIYPDRRSKINGFYTIGVMYDRWNPNYLMQNFTFSEGITVSENSLESHNQTAVFSESGYGKIYFDWPIRDIIAPHNINEYYNVTAHTTLSSNNFAAKDTLLNYYELQYPETAFTKNIIIKSINQNGTIIDDKIEFEIIPYKDKSEYLNVYLYNKVLYDTEDEMFADIISNDINPIQEKITGIGFINTTIAKTMIPFERYENYADNSIELFDIANIGSIRYEKIGDDVTYRVPSFVTLSHNTPHTFKVTINDSITREIEMRYYEFGGSQNMTINIQNDNKLDVERKIGFIIIKPPENFGYIDSLSVNGEPVRQYCKSGCTLFLLPPTILEIVAENMWGGKAYAIIPEESQYVIKEANEPNYWLVIAILIVVFVGYNVHRFIKKKI